MIASALDRSILKQVLAANPDTLTPWLRDQLKHLPKDEIDAYIASITSAPEIATAFASGVYDPTNPPPKPVFHWLTAADALAPQPPIDWIITDLFSAGSVSLVAGDPGCGKTYALLNAAACVATGQDWLGHGVKQSPVIIVDEESGERRMGRRLTEALNGAVANPDPNNLPFSYACLSLFDPRKTDHLAALEARISDTGAQLVIIDTLAAIMLGADENSVKDVQPFFSALRSLADATSSAVVIIHHTNKLGGYRGSSAMNGAVDLLLMVSRDKGSQLMTFRSEKARDVEAFEFTAQTSRDPSSGRFWMTLSETPAAHTHFNKAQAYVIRFLQQNDNQASITDIMANADTCPPNSARGAVYNLADRGVVERINPGAAGTPAIYRLKINPPDASNDPIPF